MRLISIVLVGDHGMDLHNGKPKMAWSCIQASSSKYLHECWVSWPNLTLTGPDYLGNLEEGDAVKQTITAAHTQKKDGVDIVVCLDAGCPDRSVNDIDRAIELWLDNQDKRIVAPGMWVDAAKKIMENTASQAIMYELEKAPAPAAVDYYDYVKHVLTETGYVNHSSKYNKAVADTKLPWEYRFSFFNHFAIYHELRNGSIPEAERDPNYAAAYDVMTEKREKPEPALVIGSGDSLDDALPFFKDWRGPIICSSGHASTILRYGFTGKLYIMVFDIWTRKVELDWMGDISGKDITLISHPGVNPELLAAWKGKKLYYRCMDLNNFFFNNVLPAAYDQVKTAMLLFASSAAAQMSIANAMNLSPLFLVGVDFSMRRFTKWIQNGEGWKADPDIDPIPTKPIKSDNGIWTDPLQIFYKVSALTVYRMDRCQCISTSKKSVIAEMPYASIQDVIFKQGMGFEDLYRTPQHIDDIVETYLARRNNFIVKFKGGGVRAVECGSTDEDGWKRDIESYMTAVNAQVKHEGGEEAIDVQTNIDRFTWLKANGR